MRATRGMYLGLQALMEPGGKLGGGNCMRAPNTVADLHLTLIINFLNIFGLWP